MARRLKSPCGQVLAEAALVLPLVCLMILTAVLLMSHAHNLVVLHREAAAEARRLERGDSAVSPASIGRSLWAISGIPERTYDHEAARPWRAFRAPSCVKTSGYMTTLLIKATLRPGSGGILTMLPTEEIVRGEALQEPPIPSER